ncbi:MAG: LamG domain-containing protein, partial [Planctomycetota bacterium]
EFLVVDDFESYNDLDPDDPESNRIFLTWIDGFGQPVNGSIVGYAAAPFAEQTVVHSGGQSMPLFYDNTGTARYSEAELTLSPAQDWTKSGITALSLWFSGDPNNVPDQMYVKINGSKVTYDGDAGNLTLRPWQPWNIDLAPLSIDLKNVTKFSIGFGDETSMMPGGSGVVYFDDISLYPYSRQLATPVEPNAANLIAHYELEGTTSDSSGNGLHGTAMGDPAFVAGKVGQAISLDGFNDFVEITGYKGILGPNAVTVTAWINTTTVTGTIVGWGPNVDGQRFGFRINDDRIRIEHAGGNVQGNSNITDGQWHHVAVTVQAGATISYPDVILYVDGIDDTRATTDPDAFNLTADQDVRIGSRPASNDRFFIGAIDDVRIYDRALTREEIAWLAGRTKPFDKPF